MSIPTSASHPRQGSQWDDGQGDEESDDGSLSPDVSDEYSDEDDLQSTMPEKALANVCANPFVVKNKWSYWDYIEITLTSCLILPVRLALMLIFIPIFVITCHFLYFIKVFIHRPRNYSKVKKYYLLFPTFLLRIMAITCGVWNVKFVDKSRPGDPKPSVLAVVPHSSLFDLMAVSFVGMPIFVARHATSTSWVIGPLVKLTDPILVSREDPNSRQATINTICDRAAKGDLILLLPEGTCTNREMLLRFKPGAFKPGLPVQPIFLRFGLRGNIDNLSWTFEGPSAAGTIFLTLCKLYTSLTIISHPVITPAPEWIASPALFGEHVRSAISETENIRLSYYSFDDIGFLFFAGQSGIVRSPIGLKFLKLVYKLLTSMVDKSSEGADVRRCKARDISQWYVRGMAQTGQKGPFADKMRFRVGDQKPVTLEKKALYYALLSVIDSTVYRLQSEDVERAISSKHDLLSLLDIDEVDIARSSVVDDFMHALGLQYSFEVKVEHLQVVIKLCDPRVGIWYRVRSCVNILGRATPTSNGKKFLSRANYERFIWYLLGIEGKILKDFIDQEPDTEFSFDYIQANLTKMFKRAVKENASSLMKPHNDIDYRDEELEAIIH